MAAGGGALGEPAYAPTIANLLEQDTLKYIFVGGSVGVVCAHRWSAMAVHNARYVCG
jgi:hypothetical protein